MPAPDMDASRWLGPARRAWEDDGVPTLARYTSIPCLSPAYDAGWRDSGHLAEAARLLRDWCAGRRIPGLAVEVVDLPGRTPVLVADVPARGTSSDPVLVYGHLDKQPPLGDWRPGLDPFTLVRDGERLYGRGTADDGYAVLAAMFAMEMLDDAGADHPRVVVLVEASEESGSPDLPAHLEALAPRLGHPGLVICLDSGCLTYDRLWVTSSLRGNVVATVTVEVLTEGVHSGSAGAVVPSSFRLIRQLISRIEDEATGEILLPELLSPVPEAHRTALESVAGELPAVVSAALPTVPGLALHGSTEAERLLARAWSPALAVTGMDGIPAVRDGGNVLRPSTTAKLSLRLPPTVDARVAAAAVRAALCTSPPAGARVSVDVEPPGQGWVAPDLVPWAAAALDAASVACFGRPAAAYGEGGTIPFLPMLGASFPGVPMIATGVLGPGSNAHGPNEHLHLPMATAVTVAVAQLLASAAHA